MTKNNLFGTDVESITCLIDKLEESSFNYLKLENQDLKIVIGKDVVAENTESSVFQSQAAPVNNVVPIENVAPIVDEVAAAVEAPVAEQAAPVPSKPEKPAAQANIVEIKATTAGIFYAQPEPGAAPYVKVGDKVEKDSTVGLIEIMKVYSAIPAGVEGEVTEIHVQDADFVDYGTVLFSVKVK
ncbi:biotin/lipoyl-containing protein [Niallia oryzisoli]|uniref:Biotin carboxyl carrier protein of acetyl-CoA carboxylase n=1 Tax=Niallia oryzisoli TaxID=1737571 RepID=A0ABZ2C8D0_9BACI